jgi:SAM-dependent methyltransferase
MMGGSYDPREIIEAYARNAQLEDESEKAQSLRVEIPREFIKKYLQPADVVLDAGGGTGINAIMMAEACQKVTLLDITPSILTLAEQNVAVSGLSAKVEIVEGDIIDLSRIEDSTFSFIVCVGDALSYVLDGRFLAISELVRVGRVGATLVLGCDSRLGFVRLKLAQGLLDEALAIHETGETRCGMGPRTHLYTVEEMTRLLEAQGCEVLEVASTPTISDTVDTSEFSDPGEWAKLKELEIELCTRPELLGVGLHLLFVARKR